MQFELNCKKDRSLIIATGRLSSNQNGETVKQNFSAFVGRKKPPPLTPNVVDLRDKVVLCNPFRVCVIEEFPNPGCLPWASIFTPFGGGCVALKGLDRVAQGQRSTTLGKEGQIPNTFSLKGIYKTDISLKSTTLPIAPPMKFLFEIQI